MKNLTVFSVFVLVAATATAQTRTGVTHITKLGTGWSADSVYVILSNALPNPAGCTYNDLIAMDSNTPGYKTHYANFLTAFSLDKSVDVIVSNTSCAGSAGNTRPQVIGIETQ